MVAIIIIISQPKITTPGSQVALQRQEQGDALKRKRRPEVTYSVNRPSQHLVDLRCSFSADHHTPTAFICRQ